MSAAVDIPARRRARSSALQVLVQMDLVGQMRASWAARAAAAEAVERFFAIFSPELAGDRAAVSALVRGVAVGLAGLDAALEGASLRWKLPRMGAVDRNVLRLAMHEIHDGGLPRAVGINEAVELARTYGGGDSPAFVNGVLDQVAGSMAAIS